MKHDDNADLTLRSSPIVVCWDHTAFEIDVDFCAWCEIDRLRDREGQLFTHVGVDAFWRVWNEIGEPHVHGVYESTWAAFRAALESDST